MTTPRSPPSFFQKPTLFEERKPFGFQYNGRASPVTAVRGGLAGLADFGLGDDAAAIQAGYTSADLTAYAAVQDATNQRLREAQRQRNKAIRARNSLPRDTSQFFGLRGLAAIGDNALDVYGAIHNGVVDFVGTFTGANAQKSAQATAAQIAMQQQQSAVMQQNIRSEGWVKIVPYLAVGGAILGTAIIWGVVTKGKR